MAGQTHVSVLNALEGARVRIYDELGVEIADGAGPVVPLIPPRVFVAGEFITAVQQLGQCFGTIGFQIAVRQP